MPNWSRRRPSDAACGPLDARELDRERVVTPVVTFGDVLDAYREVGAHPERSVRQRVRFTA